MKQFKEGDKVIVINTSLTDKDWAGIGKVPITFKLNDILTVVRLNRYSGSVMVEGSNKVYPNCCFDYYNELKPDKFENLTGRWLLCEKFTTWSARDTKPIIGDYVQIIKHNDKKGVFVLNLGFEEYMVMDRIGDEFKLMPIGFIPPEPKLKLESKSSFKFKIDDEVMINDSSQYKYQGYSDYTYRIKWSNTTENNYREKDLEFYNKPIEEPVKKSIETKYYKYINKKDTSWKFNKIYKLNDDDTFYFENGNKSAVKGYHKDSSLFIPSTKEEYDQQECISELPDLILPDKATIIPSVIKSNILSPKETVKVTKNHTIELIQIKKRS